MDKSGSQRISGPLYGPLCVFYYFFYMNFRRMEASEAHARQWAPSAVVGVFAWVAAWLIKPITFVYDFFSGLFAFSNENFREPCYLAVIFLLAITTSTSLARRHDAIVNEFDGLDVPERSNLLFFSMFFCIPPLVVSLAFGAKFFLISTSALVLYYMNIYIFYFRAKLKTTRKVEAKRERSQKGGE